MTGIYGDEDYAVRCEQLDCGVYGFERRFAAGRYLAVAAGKPAEIEHSGVDFFVNVFLAVCVAVIDYRVVLRATRFGKMIFRRFAGGGLYVKGVQSARFTDGFRKKLGVVSVSGGEIADNAAFSDMLAQKFLLKFQKIDHVKKLLDYGMI